MRDIKRIDRICDKLKKLWKAYPDQRFGQLIINYIPIDFNMEDESKDRYGDYKVVEDYLDEHLKEIELFNRVQKETSYCKDTDKYWEEWTKWWKKYPLRMTDTKEIIEEREKNEPKQPDWKDYIKELK